MKSSHLRRSHKKRSLKKRTAKAAILLSTMMTVSVMAQNVIPTSITWEPSDPLNISLSGSHQYDLWLNLSSSPKMRYTPGVGWGFVSIVGNTGFPGFPGTGDWGGKTIKSQFYSGAAAAELVKVSNGASGGPFPSGSSIYYGGASPVPNVDGGTLGATATAITGLTTIAFQLSIGEAYGYTLFDHDGDGIGVEDMPVLKIFDSDGALVNTLVADYHDIIKQAYNGSLDMPPGSGVDEDIYINTFGLQWDLSAYGSSVASFQIDWTGVQHAQLWSFRIDQSDAFYDSYVFDITSIWSGEGNRHWNDAANWSGNAVPAEVGKAVFATGNEVIVSEDATIGQMTISSDQDLEIKSTNDAKLTTGLNIVTEANGAGARQHVVSADLVLPSIVTLDVGEDTSLELSGDVEGLGLYKRGQGDFILSGDASFSDKMIFAGGTSFIRGQVSTTGGTAVEIKNARVILQGNERLGADIGVKLASTSTIGQAAYLQLGDETTGGITQTINSLDASKPGYVKDLNPNPQTDPPVYVIGGSDEVSTLIVHGGIYSGYLGGSGQYENNLALTVAGNLTLQGTSTYEGDTVIQSGGGLTVNRAQALSESSNLVLDGGIFAMGTFSYLIPGGSNQEGITVTESFDRFERSLGSGPGEVRFNGNGGFRAVDGDRFVNIGGDGATLTWGADGFVGDGYRLILGSSTKPGSPASATLTFENGLNFGAIERTIEIEANSTANLSGVLSGEAGWIKTGTGAVAVGSANTYAGPTRVNAGFLRVSTLGNGGIASSLGSSSSAAGNLILSNGSTTGQLVYVGEGNASTDRLFTIAGAEATIANDSASGAIHFTNTGAVDYNHNGATVLQLRGTNNETNRFDLLIADNGAYTTSLRKGGQSGLASSGGVWRIGNEANSYTGYTFVNSGFLEVTKLTNGGQLSSIGSSSNAAANLRFFRGGLRYVGSGDSTDRLLSISPYSPGAPSRIESSGTGALKFTNTGAIGLTTGASGNVAAIGTGGWLTLGGTNTDDNTFASAIGGSSATNSRFTKEGNGRWILSGVNSYKGITEILGGTLQVANLQNGNVNSNIGSSANIAANLVIDGGILDYIGAGNSTDRLMTMGRNGASLSSNGTGSVKYTATGALVQSTTGSRTLTLGGENTGDNTFALAIGNASGGETSVSKTGNGSWSLSGNNSYSGTTLIAGGELIVQSNSALGLSTVFIDGGSLSIASNVLLANDIVLEQGSVSRTQSAGSLYGLGTSGAVQSNLAGTPGVSARIVASQVASSTTTLSYQFGNSSTALNDSDRQSAIFSLDGTGTDIFVLELSADTLDANSFLGWYDEISQLWVNATEGNSTSGVLAGRYDLSWNDFILGNEGASYSELLGAWGVDADSGTVWAVLDHNSDFAAIPEPSTWALLLGSAGFLSWIARRRRD